MFGDSQEVVVVILHLLISSEPQLLKEGLVELHWVSDSRDEAELHTGRLSEDTALIFDGEEEDFAMLLLPRINLLLLEFHVKRYCTVVLMLLNTLLPKEEEWDSKFCELVTLLPLVLLLGEGTSDEGIGMDDIAC